MGQLNIEKHKVIEDGLPVENPTEEQVVEAVCNAVSLGDGLDAIFDTEAERKGKKTFMYYADFFYIINENKDYSKKWDEANRKRAMIVTEAMHTARKRYEGSGSKNDLDNLKLCRDVAQIASKTIESNITIENNQIFPEWFFTEIYKKTIHPDDYRNTEEYKKRVKECIGSDPMTDAFWSHTVGGVESSEARDKIAAREAREAMAVRQDENNSKS